MNPAIPQVDPQPFGKDLTPGSLPAYASLLNVDRPVLVVIRDSPVASLPFGGAEDLMPSCPLTELHLWLNQPLLSLLKKQAGDRSLLVPRLVEG